MTSHLTLVACKFLTSSEEMSAPFPGGIEFAVDLNVSLQATPEAVLLQDNICCTAKVLDRAGDPGLSVRDDHHRSDHDCR